MIFVRSNNYVLTVAMRMWGKYEKANNHQLVFFSIEKVSNKTFVMYIDRGTGVHIRHVFNMITCLTMLIRCCMSKTVAPGV